MTKDHTNPPVVIGYARRPTVTQPPALGRAALILAGIANVLGGLAWCALKWELTGHGTIPGSGAAFMFGLSIALATLVLLVFAIITRQVGKPGIMATVVLAIYLLLTWHTLFRLMSFR